MISIIPTKYGGVTFRSRLEARWAVFFDGLGIKWLYEFEGYNLDGLWYLPDFWLPDFNGGMFVEVKPGPFNKKENKKANLLVLNTGHALLKALSAPSFKKYEVIYKDICNGITNTDTYTGILYHDKVTQFKGNFTDEYICAVDNALSERFESRERVFEV